MRPTPVMLIAVAAIVANSSALAQSLQAPRQDNVLAYHGGADRSGNFRVPGLTWDRARSVHLDEAFQARIAGNVYAQPLYWRPRESNSGMLLVATEDNNVYGLAACRTEVYSMIANDSFVGANVHRTRDRAQSALLRSPIELASRCLGCI